MVDLTNFASTGDDTSGARSDTRGAPSDSPEAPDADTLNRNCYSPLQGPQWADELMDINELVVIPLDETVRQPVQAQRHDYKVTQRSVGWVAEGKVAALRNDSGPRRVTVPSSYSGFDDFDPICINPTAKGPATGGWGISGRHLEAVVRTLVGGGRYHVDDLTVFALEDSHGYLATYGDDTLFAAYVGGVKADQTITTTDVGPFTVPNETDEGVLEGIQSLPERLAEIPVTITEHVKTDGEFHYFATESGRQLKISGTHLTRLTNGKPWSDIQGNHSYEPYHSDQEYTFTVAEGDVRNRPGELMDMNGPDTYNYVFGYSLRYDRGTRRNADGPQYTVGVRVRGHPQVLEVNTHSDGEDRPITTRVYQSKRSDHIAQIAFDKPVSVDPKTVPDDWEEEQRRWLLPSSALNNF